MSSVRECVQANGVQLSSYVARPNGATPGRPALVLCHGFPSASADRRAPGQTFPELAERLAAETGWTVAAFDARGTGDSTGDFSASGWMADIAAVVAHLDAEVGSGVWLAGFGAGGALALVVAAGDTRVRGVATLGAPLVLGAKGPELLAAARNLGMFRTPGYPPDPARWLAELAALDPLEAARDLGGRALLVVHGTDDTEVPVFEARALADAAEHVELRMLHGAGSQLRHDPRAIAVLVGWLERQAVAA